MRRKITLLAIVLSLIFVGAGCGQKISQESKEAAPPAASPAAEQENPPETTPPAADSDKTAKSVSPAKPEQPPPPAASAEEKEPQTKPCPYECCAAGEFEGKTCSSHNQVCRSNKCKWTGPVDIPTDAQISGWGANCKSKGTAEAIAECILDWQAANIVWCYTHPEATSYFDYFSPEYPDCVVDMQFQQMVPNSFPVSKALNLKVRNGKMFGACYTYATTFCAAARWNGLECRVMEAKTAISFYSASSGDYAEGYCGSAPKTFLDKLGYGCDEWRKKNWAMDADHYWAEVKINGQWKLKERPTWAYQRDTTKYIINAGRSYGDTGW